MGGDAFVTNGAEKWMCSRSVTFLAASWLTLSFLGYAYIIGSCINDVSCRYIRFTAKQCRSEDSFDIHCCSPHPHCYTHCFDPPSGTSPSQ
jgi:hypothetical protein